MGPKEVVTFWALFISRGPAFEEPKGRKKGDCRWSFNGTEKKYPFVTYQKSKKTKKIFLNRYIELKQEM